MFSPQGPSLRELAMQALSSVEGGYDLLAPKFDHTPFRTPDGVLEATADALRPLGPFGPGLDVCCGTGAGMRVLNPARHQGLTALAFAQAVGAQSRGRRSGPTRATAARRYRLVLARRGGPGAFPAVRPPVTPVLGTPFDLDRVRSLDPRRTAGAAPDLRIP